LTPPRRSRIYVLAGTNGSGKSSIGGAIFRELKVDYFNPDEAAGRMLSRHTAMSLAEANSAAWAEGRRLLERAISERRDYVFETTLGGRTITSLLAAALSEGIEVRVWYVGLQGADLHIERVRSRVARGGHNIPDEKILERYNTSRQNLISLLPKLTELRVYDNSANADPSIGETPRPLLILHVVRGVIATACDPADVPEWAQSIVFTAVAGSGNPDEVD
jgi:predicted ABC-type ATPase